jgi:WD40 repeat protein
VERAFPVAPWGATVVAFSPDGKALAAGGRMGMVVLWALQDEEARPRALAGHTGGVTALSWAPGGARLASASLDGSVKLWDVRLAQEVLTLGGHTQAVHALAFSRDGRYLASAGKDRAVLVREAP